MSFLPLSITILPVTAIGLPCWRYFVLTLAYDLLFAATHAS
jgi:hypothetical protein